MDNLPKYEQELLTILAEECAEVIQECSKIIRFGMTQENLDRLEKELGDLYCMIDLVHANDMVSFTKLDEYSHEKYEKLKKWSNLFA